MSRKILLLPGLLGDDFLSRCLEGSEIDFKQLQLKSFVAEETLEDHAIKYLDDIPKDGNCIICGSTLGRTLAVEIARHKKVKGIVAVSSCLNSNELSSRIRMVEELGIHYPNSIVKKADIPDSMTTEGFGFANEEQRVAYKNAIENADEERVRWGTRLMLSYFPAPLKNVPIYRLHGKLDRIAIPYKTTNVTWIPDGGHLLTLSHPRLVCNFVLSVIAGTVAPVKIET